MKIPIATDDNTLTLERRICITRLFDAPRELVFRAWTDPEMLLRWYAPKGCTLRFSYIDMRQGGSFLSCISNPDHGDCWCKAGVRELVENERLIYTMTVADAEGRPVNPADVGMHPEWPAETLVSVSFSDHEGKTKVVLYQTAPEDLARKTGAYPSWLQMMDRLEEMLHHS